VSEGLKQKLGEKARAMGTSVHALLEEIIATALKE